MRAEAARGIVLGVALIAFALVVEDRPHDLVLVALGTLASIAATPSSATARRREQRWARLQAFLGCRLPSPSVMGVTAFTLAVAYATLGGPASWPELVRTGDWGVNEAFIGAFVEANQRGEPLRWATEISAGEPLPDLYPTIVHRLIAALAPWLASDPEWIPRAMGGAVALAFVATALGAAWTTLRLGGAWPAACLAAWCLLLDDGSDYSWGYRSVLFWGFFPSACAVGIVMLGTPWLLDAGRSRRPWVAPLVTACAAFFHPVGLIMLGGLIVGGALTWATSTRGPAREGLTITVALLAGLAFSAFQWSATSQHVVDFGLHYGTPVVPIPHAAEAAAKGLLPDGSFALLVFAAWVTALVSVRSADARRSVLGIAGAFICFLYAETIFLDLGLAPSRTTVRWQAYRVGMIAKPFLVAMGAIGIGRIGRIGRLFHAPALQRVIPTTAALALLAAVAHEPTRAQLEVAFATLETRSRVAHVPPAYPGFERVLVHLEQARRADRPEGRVLMFCPTECRYAALPRLRERGFRTLVSHVAPAGFFLREQFHTATPENLRRFGIEWVIGTQREPPPAVGTVERFGDFLLTRVDAYDGVLAHPIDPTHDGALRTEILPGNGLRIEADRPARVRVGMPYYPRLVATHDGARIPVEAERVDGPSSELAVVLDVPAGRTEIRADGPLRGDASWPKTALFLTFGLALLGVMRGLMGRGPFGRLTELAGSPRIRILGRLAIALAPIAVGIAMSEGWGRARTLRFGWFTTAPTIELVDGAATTRCQAELFGRSYRCGDARVVMATSHTLNERRTGWPVPAPAIRLETPRPIELRMTFPVRLQGEYYATCLGCSATLDGAEPTTFDGSTRRVRLSASPARVTLRGGDGSMLTVLPAEALDPPAPYPGFAASAGTARAQVPATR